MNEIIKNLGPLAPLAGHWEGNEGIDVSPSKKGAVTTKFRELITFDPIGPVTNGPQALYGLKYTTTAWSLGDVEPFHEEVGYWLWDADAQQVMRCFIVPRGVTVNAGGSVAADAKSFSLRADVGSEIYGVMSNPFLDKAFKTVCYTLKVTINDDGSFSYQEDTQLAIQGLSDIFHHTDQNRLNKI
jgi:hypothetical protein